MKPKQAIVPQKSIALVGYSGHAYVACEIFQAMGLQIGGYLEPSPKAQNPYDIPFLGNDQEIESLQGLEGLDYFVAIGDNRLRAKILKRLQESFGQPVSAIHPSVILSPTAQYGPGAMLSAGCIVQAQVQIGAGVICNTGCIIEHESQIGNCAHIAPGAVLCGNVQVGAESLVGANSVVLPNIRIGKGARIGAGCVVIRDVADNETVVGNPQQKI